MKKSSFVLIFLLTGLIFVSGVKAQGPPGDWTSDIACQNLDTQTPANVTLTFYPQGQSEAAMSYDDIIPAGGSKFYSTADLGVPDGFLGSVVVDSSQSVVCAVNTLKQGDGSSASPYRIASSSGVDASGSAGTMYAPQVMKDYTGWDSYVSVQNTSDAEISVEVTYKNRAGEDVAEATETATIPAYSNTVFDQATNDGLPSEFIGSARVSVTEPADGKMTMVVNFYNDGSDSETSQFHSYNGFGSGAGQLYIPRVVRLFYGYNSGVTVQNVGEVETSVTMTFYFGGEEYTYNSDPIAPSAAEVLYLPDVAVLEPVDDLIVNYRFGNAFVQADDPEGEIVAIINEDNRGNTEHNDGEEIPPERVGQGSTYSAIPVGAESKQLYFPQVPAKAEDVFSGGFYISNVTDQEGVCDITFYQVPEATLDDVSIAANGSLSYYAPNIANLPDGFNGSVRANCTVEVIGIHNFAVEPGSGKVGDSFTQNNAFTP